MTERPDYIRCIQHTHADRKKTSWCSKTLYSLNFMLNYDLKRLIVYITFILVFILSLQLYSDLLLYLVASFMK